MSYTPKKYGPESFGDMLYEGIGTLNTWLETDPERLILTNKIDFEKVETLGSLRRVMGDFPEMDDETRQRLDETEYLVSTQFWCSAAFAMAYRFQQALVKELAAIPTAEGEAEIAKIREDLADVQEILLESPIFKAALARAALVGDAEFVTNIDFQTPKWHKVADSADLDDSEKK